MAMRNRTIQRRLARLESNATYRNDNDRLFIIEFVAPNERFGGPPCPIEYAETLDGQSWTRKRGEAPDKFQKRVIASLENPNALIFLHPRSDGFQAELPEP